MLHLVLFTILFVVSHTMVLAYLTENYVLASNIGVADRAIYVVLTSVVLLVTTLGIWFLGGCILVA